MKNFLKNSSILLILALLISSCALIPRPKKAEKEKLLIENLQRWNEFQLEGIIEANYNSFSFRKNIMIRKNNDAIRLDVFDSGFMGLNPTPFLSIYLDSTLVLRLPFSKEFVSAEEAGIKDFDSVTILSELDNLLLEKNKIISKKKLEFPEYKIYFSDNMQIEKIELINKPITLMFSYIDDLDQISVLNDEKQVANIQIDRIEYKNIEIPILK
jgi:hypothetical protein